MKRLLLLAFVLAACNQGSEPPPQVTEATADSADQVAQGFETASLRGDGVRLSYIRGDSAWYYQTSQTWVIKGLTVIFPDSNGRTISTITSRRGTYNVSDQSLDARDSVVGKTPEGQVLKTEHLIWSNATNEISSDTAFTLTSPTAPPLIRGSNFTATPDFRNVHISRPSGRLTAAPKPATPARKAPPRTPPATRGTTGG